MESQFLIDHLKSLSNPKNVEGMARFGISSTNTLGISMPEIRKLAKSIKKDHSLALELWDSGIHEAKILACLIADKKQLTRETMDKWVYEIDSWDVCDQVSGNLFIKTKFYKEFIFDCALKEDEFVRRTAFSMIAYSAVHHKRLNDLDFLDYLPLFIKYCTDERNFVKKAVNWAIRQIGKRSLYLNEKMVKFCESIIANNANSKSAKWIAKGAIRELTSDKTIAIISKRKNKLAK